MFDILIVAYLFLGGMGAAAILISCCIDIWWSKEPFGVDSDTSLDTVSSSARIVWYGLLVGLLALAVGVLCLTLDLGRFDRIAYLFQYPSLSWLTVGSFALFALLACAAFLALVRFLYLPFIERTAVIAVEIVTIIIAVVVMVYTGLLLQSFSAIALWNTPLLPILFVASSLSTGFAVLFLVAFFGDHDLKSTALLRRLKNADLVTIAAELVVAALFMYFSLNSAKVAETGSAQQLFFGEGALVWWGGFAVCGLLVPVVLEFVAFRTEYSKTLCLALAGVLILIGALSLRWGIVDSGMHRELELEAVPTLSLEDASAVTNMQEEQQRA